EGMKLAHQQDIIIGDRKPENSLIGDNVNLFHADLDTMICLHNLEERVTRKKGKYSAIATDGYGFNPDIVDGEPRSVKEFLMAHGKADDEYAMLRVLMLLTSGKNIGSFNQVKKTVDGREKIETQITRLVKPEYHDRIKCLCFAPDEYARIYKDNPQYLVDMLNFEPRSPA
ncbi:MAG: hypothetical protein ACXWIN_08580, partial [Burkholderiaceae bacterium]